eukprot:TRINITY_DN569_c0_g2_i3.p1 TRINITY_DN569_c0_g2~~TRINITY_DN569_c0_g2_i3.p1  ORF type:complete len:122 (+),score=29.01 TRINITY_DN569_c0_g2_i3:180-545(+)
MHGSSLGHTKESDVHPQPPPHHHPRRTRLHVSLPLSPQQRFMSNDTNMFCLRAMTGAIILYDHIAEAGVFVRRSPVNVKAAIQILKTYTEGNTDGLLNALRFTTIHLGDAETPQQIKQLLA